MLLLLAAVLLPALGARPARAETPNAPRPQAQRLISELEANTAQRKLTDPALARARDALSRAAEARRKKQHEIAALLDRVALTWAELGSVLVRSAALESEASTLEKEQNELETKLKRARALLEETLARRARAKAALAKLESPPPPAPAVSPPPATPPAAAPTPPPAAKTTPATQPRPLPAPVVPPNQATPPTKQPPRPVPEKR